MPTTLLFDLDDTLWDDNASLEACVLRVCEGLVGRLPPFDAMTLTRYHIMRSKDYWRRQDWDVERIPESRLTLWTQTLAAFGCNDPDIAVEARDAYAIYRHEHVVCYEETREVIAALHKRYRLAGITDGHGEVQRARMHLAGLDGFFDAIVAATDVGVSKPHAAIFEQALKAIAASPANSWHIGDSLKSDVGGARNAGLNAAVWLNRDGSGRSVGDPEPDHEVESLRAFTALLESTQR